MKKILLTMVALLSMTAMMAQSNNNGKGKPKKMTHEEMTTQMTSKLNLNDTQKSQVAALNKEYQDYLMQEPPQKPDGEKATDGKNEKNGKSGKNAKNGKKPAAKKQNTTDNSQRQAKRQEYETKLKQILTDDQYQSYQKMGPQGKGKSSKDNKDNKNGKSKKNKKSNKE